MSIIEDLELLDLPDDLPDGLEFDLDDILFEFSTPGLYASPAREQEPLPKIIEEDDSTLVFAAVEDPEMVTMAADDFFGGDTEMVTLAPESFFGEDTEMVTLAPESFFGEDTDMVTLTPESFSAEDADMVTVAANGFFGEDADMVTVAADSTVSEDTTVYSGDLFGNPFGLGDILYEFGTPVDEDGVKVYAPSKAVPIHDEDEDDVKVYVPADAEPSADTVSFTAMPETKTLAPEHGKAKVSDLLAKAAGAVMGLLSIGKKKKSAPQTAYTPAVEDPFLHARELFEEAAEIDVEDSSLMLELELLAELKAEREAKQAAWEAEDRIVHEPVPAAEVPEAITVLQREAEEAAAQKAVEELAAQMAADEAAAQKALGEAFLRAVEEYNLPTEEHDELFEWIEATNKLRRKPDAEDIATLQQLAEIPSVRQFAEDAAAQKAMEEAAAQRAAEEAAARKVVEEAAMRRLMAEAAARKIAAEHNVPTEAHDGLFEWIASTNKLRRKPDPEEFERLMLEIDHANADMRAYLPMVDAEDMVKIYSPDHSYAEAEDAAELSGLELTNEEGSAEIRSLLENPDTEGDAPAIGDTITPTVPLPEEPTASDDDLRYVPEAPPVKLIGAHIGKKLSAFAAALTASGSGEDEEALGPEVSATKAYRFFNKFINDYRFRLRLAAVLCVISGWISLGLPVFGSLKNPAAAAAMCLMLLLTVMLAGADILASGFTSLLRRQPSLHSLVVVSCLASVADAMVIIATKGKGGYLPFCGVSAISMCFAIYGSLLYCRSQRLNFKTLEQCAEPLTISVDYGIVDSETTTVYRTIGHPEQYIHRSEEEDLSESVYGQLAPLLLLAIPVLSLLAALLSKGLGDFFHIMAAMFSAAASFSALVAFPLPYFLTQRDLYATKSAIAGWTGAKEIGRVSTMIVTDRDLFPDETVVIKSVRIVDEVNPDLTLSYFCSMIKESGSCLVPAFAQLAENNGCELRPVENFRCHEAGGLSGMIGPDEVLIASHSYMKLQGFRIPARKKDSENALFMAANGHVIAYIVVDYKPIKSVRAGLESALRGSVEMVFAARDFNITPLLISKKFKSPTETLRFPSYSQRYKITSHGDSDTAISAAVVSRKSFFSYAAVVEKARYLYRSVTLSVTLSVVSSIMGIVLMFIMALSGAGAAVTVGRLLVFMLLWLIPTLALTISITK